MDVFDLVAKIRLDSSEYESGVGEAKGTFSNLASGVKNGLATVGKVGAAAVSAGVAGVTALTKMGVEGYAQYEQLTGGVETLFKDSSGTVMNYADNAYKTAGLSANAYMETLTSFTASLIQSLDGDTAKAAEVGNLAITDMSDNANKMGTSIGMIQNAYQGFAKQNYTMLDNLKLGYGGTKTEMQRLLEDAAELKGLTGDAAFMYVSDGLNGGMANIIDAIHTVQTELGITGTTALEAATTIEGSLSMMKGAWENLIVGMADENANFDLLIDNFVESTATAAQNLLPRIEQTLIGIGKLITALAPVIAEALPVLVEDVLPALLAAAVSLVVALVNGIITALPALYTALLEGVQTILVQVFGVSEEKAGEFANGVNSFFVKIKDGFIALVESAQTEGTWLNGIWTGLQNTAKLLGEFLSVVWDTLVKAWQWCVKQFKTEGSYLDTVWDNIKIVISGVVTHIQELLKVFIAVFKGDWKGAWEGVKNIFKNAWNTMRDLIKNVWDFIKSVVSKAVEAVKSAISEKFTAVKEKVSSIFNSIKTTISNVWDKIKSVVKTAIMFIVELVKAWFNLVTLPFRAIWENCKETIIAAWNKIKSTVSNALDAIKSTISKVWNAISSVLSPILDKIKSAVSTAWNAIKSAVSSVMNSVKSTVSTAWNSVKSAVSGVITSVKSTISTGLNSAKSTVSSVLEGIKSKFTSIFNGAKTIVQNAINFIKGLFKFEWSLPKIKLPHFSITGEFSLSPPSVPKLTISWYKKAYDSAMVLGSPTIFGYSAASGKYLGGGDGNGNEIVAGESYLMGLIGSVVEGKTAEQNERIVSVLGAILEAITGGNREMLQALLEGQTIVLNNREFGRAVREYAR